MSRMLRGALFTVISLVLLIAPNVVWFYINRDTYFETGVDRLSVGALLTLLFVFALMRGAFKDIDKRTTTIISLATVLAILWFFDAIIGDLWWIVLSGLTGYVMYLFFAIVAKRDLEYHRTLKDEKTRIRARKSAQEEELGSV